MSIYSVACECGHVHSVSGADAGRAMPCPCGLTVDIPLLSQLRRGAGEAVVSPELEIPFLEMNGRLLEDPYCLICGLPTEEIVTIHVVCETITVSTRATNQGCAKQFAAFLMFGWVGMLIDRLTSDRDEEQFGRNVQFRLPIRLCGQCRDSRSRPSPRELLEKVPVYQRLLKKYPHSQIGKLQAAKA